MSFSSDRDLLAIEPAVFEDVPFAAQKRLSVSDASISGTTLTSLTADFISARIDPGSVVLINGITYEVIDRTDTHTLEVSLPRSQTTDPGIPGGDGIGLELVFRTFAPQAKLVHDGLLRLIGIDPDNPEAGLPESSVLSVKRLAHIEALGTLEVIYSGAASLVGENDTLLMKAGEYRKRFRQACAGASILIDTDGDGLADERLPLGNVCLRRI